jgi:hypothetical protein
MHFKTCSIDVTGNRVVADVTLIAIMWHVSECRRKREGVKLLGVVMLESHRAQLAGKVCTLSGVEPRSININILSGIER